MDKLQEIKDKIIGGIEAERENANLRYEKEKKIIEYTNSVPVLIKELVEIYGNTHNQSDKMIEILDDFLEANLFKNAKNEVENYSIVKGGNYVYYNYKEFYVGVSTSRIPVIVVGRNESLREPAKPILMLNNAEMELIDMFDNYIVDDEATFDSIINMYSEVRRSKPAGIMFKKKMRKSGEIAKYVLGLMERKETFEKKLEMWEKDVEFYDSEKKELQMLIDDISKDLEKFKDAGWEIKYESLDNLINQKVTLADQVHYKAI